MLDAVNAKLLAIYVAIQTSLYFFKNEERGDTNFISISIILAIVVILVATFLGFRDQIMSVVSDKVNKFAIY